MNKGVNMIIDIRDVFIYSDDFFFDLESNLRYEYKDFLEEIDAVTAPVAMYQSSFIHDRLMASSIIRGQRSNIKQSIMLLPYIHMKDRIREIRFVSIRMKYDNMVFANMIAGVSNRENPIVLVTDLGSEVEYLLCYRNEIQISEYHDTFSEGHLDEFTKRSQEKFEDKLTTICVADQMLSSKFDEHLTYKEICDLVKDMTNEKEGSYEEKL